MQGKEVGDLFNFYFYLDGLSMPESLCGPKPTDSAQLWPEFMESSLSGAEIQFGSIGRQKWAEGSVPAATLHIRRPIVF